MKSFLYDSFSLFYISIFEPQLKCMDMYYLTYMIVYHYVQSDKLLMTTLKTAYHRMQITCL